MVLIVMPMNGNMDIICPHDTMMPFYANTPSVAFNNHISDIYDMWAAYKFKLTTQGSCIPKIYTHESGCRAIYWSGIDSISPSRCIEYITCVF